ncbi:MAG: pantetheine-phosphate adenylyltransferase [Omnitrophica bacterium GWA2_52_12]|nr:MAG: pantetheine-phosphate adenylyltransferase [Omnitrophica bacterium GWA2_52_12]
MVKQRAIYPGSFDPVTFGHLDLIERALSFFQELYVVVAVNPGKDSLFTLEERLDMMKRAVKPFKRVHVESSAGLTVAYARKRKAKILIRGLRATSDFDYEFQMALTNRKLAREIDTIFLMPSESYFYVSSRLIKEIAQHKGDVASYVPDFVRRRIHEKLFSRGGRRPQ